MAKNQESINSALFELLRSRGYSPTLLDTSGKEIPIPDEAEVFQFKFTKDDKEYGTVTLSIDGLHKLVVYFNDDVANSEKESTSDGSWYKLLNHLKRFAQQHQLSFDVKNTDHLKFDMAKREHMKKQERISEGYHPMGKAKSYSDAVPTTKIIIQHNKNIEEGEQRYRNVAKIFVENSEGERFAVPTTKPGIARVYARHIAEGGTPYDEKGKHITSLCEEYQKMGAFVRATRNGQFNESAQQLVNEGINHYQSLRETLGRMTGHRGYTAYFESWTPSLMEDDTDTSNLNELFVQETLDPRIESVMPILNKLHKKVAEMKEVGALAEWADSLTEAPGAETLAHNEKTEEDNLDSLDLEESDTQSSNPQGIPEDQLDELNAGTLSNYVNKAVDDLADRSNATGMQKGARVASQALAGGKGDAGRFEKDDKIANRKIGISRAISKIREEEMEDLDEEGKGLWANIHAKRERIKNGSGEKMRKPGSKGAPSAQNFRDAAKEDVEMDEGVADSIKKGMQVLDRIVTGGDKEDLLKDLKKKANVRNPENGKPSMAHSDVEKVDEDEFAGDYATGEAGQWRNKGPKANKPATIGDLVGEGQEDLNAIKRLLGK